MHHAEERRLLELTPIGKKWSWGGGAEQQCAVNVEGPVSGWGGDWHNNRVKKEFSKVYESKRWTGEKGLRNAKKNIVAFEKRKRLSRLYPTKEKEEITKVSAIKEYRPSKKIP